MNVVEAIASADDGANELGRREPKSGVVVRCWRSFVGLGTVFAKGLKLGFATLPSTDVLLVVVVLSAAINAALG